MRDSVTIRGVPLLLTLLLLSVFSFAQFEGTLSLMLEHRFNYDEQKTTNVFVYIGVVLVLVQGLLVRRYVKVFGERVFARGGLALMALGLAGVAFADDLRLLLPALAVAVAGFGAINPAFNSLISRSTDASRQGGIMGLVQSASALGRILGPWIGNLIYGSPKLIHPGEKPLLDAAFGDLPFHRRPYIAAAAILVVLAVAALWIPRPRDETVGEPPAS